MFSIKQENFDKKIMWQAWIYQSHLKQEQFHTYLSYQHRNHSNHSFHLGWDGWLMAACMESFCGVVLSFLLSVNAPIILSYRIPPRKLPNSHQPPSLFCLVLSFQHICFLTLLNHSIHCLFVFVCLCCCPT